MKSLIAVIIAALVLTSCATADQYLGRTTVNYQGPGITASYDSNKNQQDFKAKVSFDEEGKVKDLDISTTATTPESAIIAISKERLESLQLIRDLMAQIQAMRGGS